jgi:hypothetical protein
VAKEVTIVRSCDRCLAEATVAGAETSEVHHEVAVTDGHDVLRLDLCRHHYLDFLARFGPDLCSNPGNRRYELRK